MGHWWKFKDLSKIQTMQGGSMVGNSMNNTVVVDHDGLFIHVNPGYHGLYHNGSIL
jgi:hypothetical protein